MTRTEFLASPLWTRLAAAHGWTESTFDTIARTRAALDAALAGVRGPAPREKRIDQHIATLLTNLGATPHEAWQQKAASRFANPAKDVTPPDWVTDCVMVMWMWGDAR